MGKGEENHNIPVKKEKDLQLQFTRDIYTKVRIYRDFVYSTTQMIMLLGCVDLTQWT